MIEILHVDAVGGKIMILNMYGLLKHADELTIHEKYRIWLRLAIVTLCHAATLHYFASRQKAFVTMFTNYLPTDDTPL